MYYNKAMKQHGWKMMVGAHLNFHSLLFIIPHLEFQLNINIVLIMLEFIWLIGLFKKILYSKKR